MWKNSHLTYITDYVAIVKNGKPIKSICYKFCHGKGLFFQVVNAPVVSFSLEWLISRSDVLLRPLLLPERAFPRWSKLNELDSADVRYFWHFLSRDTELLHRHLPHVQYITNNVGWRLGQRRRRLPSIEPTLILYTRKIALGRLNTV